MRCNDGDTATAIESRSEQIDAEIDAELESHIEMRTEDNLAAGMTPEQARRGALLRFGNPVIAKEKAVGSDAMLELDGLWRDCGTRSGN